MAQRNGIGNAAHCRDLTRTYRTTGRRRLPWRHGRGPEVTALRDVSLTVKKGEIVGIAGPSGSGKSTLLHLLAGLDRPTSGTVTIAGTDVTDASERRKAHIRLNHVGIVFQRFHLLPGLTARSNVTLPLIQKGVSGRTRRKRARELLDRVGLGDRIHHRPGQLSGGEQQRVAIARALVTDPDLLVADEPTGELDTHTGNRILTLLTDLAEDRGAIIASHDHATLEATDRIVHLRDGKRVE